MTKLLLRVLLVIVLGAYLYQRYGPLLREQASRLSSGSGDKLVQRVPGVGGLFPKLSHDPELRTGYLPRRDLTPGSIDRHVTQANIRATICRAGYARAVRPPFEYTNRMKHRVMRSYGVTGNIHDYELDHLIPLELGGCPYCETNLWPEERNVFPGAKEKDQVEDYLHHKVCSGETSLAEAQHQIATDWYSDLG